MDSTVSTPDEVRSIAARINGEGLDSEKLVTGDDEVRAFLGKNTGKIPPAVEMLERLKKYEKSD
jgi:hypothetical protein